jgi:hypothetical protein
MVNKNFLEELERKWDYSIALVEEIWADISKLNEYPTSTLSNKLDEINNKLDFARGQWINVDVLDKQLLDFRLITFIKDIDKKIYDINIKWNNFNTDLSKIEEEYKILQREDWLDFEMLAKKIDILKEEVKKWQLLLKVKDIAVSWWASIYNLEWIQVEYLSLKDKWIDVSEIEEILFEI